MRPEDIETESFRIILEELGPHNFSSQALPIVQRVIHTTADFEYKDLIHFSPNAIENGVAAIRRGEAVFSDVSMIVAGVSKPLMKLYGCDITCLVSDPKVARLAKEQGKTRSETAMRQLGPHLSGSIILIGNAPTALFEVLRLYDEEGIRPALVVGAPVGFVNALESKAALAETDLDFITINGRKGGSTVAVSIFNALLRLARS